MVQPVEARRDISRFLNIRTAISPRFGHDDQRVRYLTNTTGVFQLWSVPHQGGWPEQLTFHGERVGELYCDPQRDRSVFLMDAGGNENHQLNLVVGAGEVEVQLTEDPGAIHAFFCFAPDGRRVAYASNDRDRAVFDVLIARLEDHGLTHVERVIERGGTWRPVCFSRDQRGLVVCQATGNMDQRLWLLDCETRALTPIGCHQPGAVRYLRAFFGPAENELVVWSDVGGDFLRLWRVDRGRNLASPPDWTPLDAGGWDVEQVVGGAEGRLLAYARNVDGVSEVHLLDLERGDDQKLGGLPVGVVTGLDLSHDGTRLAVGMTPDQRTGDIFVCDLSSGTVSQITHSSLAGIPPTAMIASVGRAFPTFDGREIPGRLYRAISSADTPCVVWVHGGPESQFRPAFNPIVQYLVNSGFTVFAPNVRGSAGYGRAYGALDDVGLRPHSVADLGACARWLGTLEGIDPDRIAVLGGSYGGFMVLATLTTDPDLWAAGVDIVGIANMVTFLENTAPWRRHLRESEYGSLEHDRALLEAISPIHQIDRVTAPLMVIHGANDPRVPVGEAEQVVAAMNDRGVAVTYLRYEDEGHGIAKLHNKLTCYPAIVAFLRRHLDVSEPVSGPHSFDMGKVRE